MNAIAATLVRWLTRTRGRRMLNVIEQLPLFGGSVVHVIDVDGRRLVFATSQSAICLLAQFECCSGLGRREEAANPVADTP